MTRGEWWDVAAFAVVFWRWPTVAVGWVIATTIADVVTGQWKRVRP